MSQRIRIAIIGGGAAGLSAAHVLARHQPDKQVSYCYKVNRKDGQAMVSKERATEDAVQSVAWTSSL